MIVVGGSYREICLVPEWDRIFGSGGRAAIAISSRTKKIKFFTYASDKRAADILQTMQMFGIETHIARTDEDVSFSYFHPLSPARLSPENPTRNRALEVSGNAVLRFGLVEGDAVVRANYAVYDPQGGPPFERFEANGSSANHLAYVLNENEVRGLTGKTTVSAAASDLLRGAADVVVVKRGTQGVSVFQRNGKVGLVPAYRSESVFKIGSGDVFSAIFAYEWGRKRLSPKEAADAASRAVAFYVETRSLTLPTSRRLKQQKALRPRKTAGMVYLAGPFFDIAKRWLIEETLDVLESLGASVFSPLHEVGFGRPEEIAKKDLKGLEKCSAMLALIDGGDPGTLFEVGYAVKKGIPVVALAENVSETDLTMLLGSGCEVVSDFASAMYRAAWLASMR